MQVMEPENQLQGGDTYSTKTESPKVQELSSVRVNVMKLVTLLGARTLG